MKKYLLSIMIFMLVFMLPFLHIMGNINYWLWNSGNVENKEEIIMNTYEFMQLNTELKFYDENVRSHLRDVRTLYWNSIIFFFSVLVLGILLSYFMNKKEIKAGVINACKAIIFMWVFFGLWAIISFDTFFDSFHKLFFSGNYIFPMNNLIIQLFPQVFFENWGIIIFLSEIVLASLIIYLVKK